MSAHWLHPRQKRPVDAGWSEADTQTLEDLEDTYQSNANIGVRLGKWSKIRGKYLHLIDLDVRDDSQIDDAKAALARFWPDFEAFPYVISGSGGESRHFYFLTDKPFYSRKLAHSDEFTMVMDPKKGREVRKWDWEIELFGSNKQAVLPPSIHPDTGKPYVWGRALDLEDLDLGLTGEVDVSLVETWVPRHIDEEEVEAKPPLGLTRPECQEILAKLDLDEWCEDRDGWLQVGMALHHEFSGADEGYDLWVEFSKQSTKFDPRNQQAVWDSFKPKANSVRMATLKKVVANAELREMFEDVDDDDDLDIDDICGSSEPEKVAEEADGDVDWTSKLERNDEGQVKSTLPNIVLYLRNDPRTKGMIRYNEFVKETYQFGVPGTFKMRKASPKGCIQLDSPVWSQVDPIDGRKWTDALDTQIRYLLEVPVRQGGHGIKVADRDVRGAIDVVARMNPYHPVKSYLTGLTWRGEQGIERLFVDFLGAEDNAYHRHAAKLFMVAAVARVFEPGHKFDFVPIIEGVQGKGKSTFIKTLARHDSWYTEVAGDFQDTKSMVEKMQGHWICELPELQGFTKSEVNDIKMFISIQRDNCRLAYAHRADTYPRQCVLVGSTNDSNYLRDPTGGRRFWPIYANIDRIDIERLKAVRDQLWAEAYHVYRQMRAEQPEGDLPLYMTDELAASLALEMQETRRVETVEETMGQTIQEWLDKPIPGDFDDGTKVMRTVTCLAQLWVEALGRDMKGYDARAPQAIARAMRFVEGWEPHTKLTIPGYGRPRTYIRVKKENPGQ